MKCLFRSVAVPVIAALTLSLFAGCQSGKEEPSNNTVSEAKPAPTGAPAASRAQPTVRINAGATEKYTDSAGNVWLPDQGFADGETIERESDMQIANTKNPVIYRTEHYEMSSFSHKLPNGKYTVKFHFAETYDGISGPGDRVFSFKVEGHEFKDFDVFAKTGGAQHAYVKTVNVEVTDDKLEITFTPNIQSPEINGIEIIPAS
ncbi:MAG TPA: malectin domain-containing carbohydrate-binding protein [Verrucomicrobiae bacterium]|nr:malectin domain-containing carbohydrate-binding protein [Verrucomicrobiae bacterium]